MLELTEALRNALEANAGQPLRLFDSRTRQTYVLLPAAMYEKLEGLLGEEFDPRAAYPLVERMMAEDDLNDPSLESYQHVRREGTP